MLLGSEIVRKLQRPSLEIIARNCRRLAVARAARTGPGRYPSRKMGVTVQFESHCVELPTVFELEHDDDVLEYYDQVSAINLYYHLRTENVSEFSTRRTSL